MHPIHKHGSGMRSAERYDAKEAYNKKLSSKARMHYLENDIADHKGMSREGNAGDHMMTSGAYKRHTESNSNTNQHHSKGVSRQASPLNDFKGGYHKVQHAKGEAHKGTSRKSSPANNVSYGDKSGKTGYIGEAKYDMEYNAVDDITQGKGKADYGMSRKYCSKK